MAQLQNVISHLVAYNCCSDAQSKAFHSLTVLDRYVGMIHADMLMIRLLLPNQIHSGPPVLLLRALGTFRQLSTRYEYVVRACMRVARVWCARGAQL